MTRRLFSTFFLLILLAGPAWAKLRQDEQEYFDNKFHGLLEQIQGLSKQVQALNTLLAQVQQNQAQFQEALARHDRGLQDLEQLVSSLRSSDEENLAALKTTLAQMRAETQKSLSALGGRPADVTAIGTTPGLNPPSHQTVQAYVTIAQGNEVVIDQGSAKGLHVGSRLTLYKSTDPNTPVGELEVTEVMDAGNSRAKIVNARAGVRPDFGDIARLE